MLVTDCLNEGEPLTADDAAVSVAHGVGGDQEIIDTTSDSLGCVRGDDGHHIVDTPRVLRQILRLTELHGDELHSVKVTDDFCGLLRASDALGRERSLYGAVLSDDVNGMGRQIDNFSHNRLLSSGFGHSEIFSESVGYRPDTKLSFRKVG